MDWAPLPAVTPSSCKVTLWADLATCLWQLVATAAYTEQQLVVMLPPEVLELLSNSVCFKQMPSILTSNIYSRHLIRACRRRLWKCKCVYLHILQTGSNISIHLKLCVWLPSKYMLKYSNNVFCSPPAPEENTQSEQVRERWVHRRFYSLEKGACCSWKQHLRWCKQEDAKLLRRSVELQKRVIILSGSPFHITPWHLTP